MTLRTSQYCPDCEAAQELIAKLEHQLAEARGLSGSTIREVELLLMARKEAPTRPDDRTSAVEVITRILNARDEAERDLEQIRVNLVNDLGLHDASSLEEALDACSGRLIELELQVAGAQKPSTCWHCKCELTPTEARPHCYDCPEECEGCDRCTP